jgi:hypothetical protein
MGFHRRSDSAIRQIIRLTRIAAGETVSQEQACRWRQSLLHVESNKSGTRLFLVDNGNSLCFRPDRVQVTKNLLGNGWLVPLSNKQANKRRCLRNASADIRPTNKVLIHELSNSIGWCKFDPAGYAATYKSGAGGRCPCL